MIGWLSFPITLSELYLLKYKWSIITMRDTFQFSQALSCKSKQWSTGLFSRAQTLRNSPRREIRTKRGVLFAYQVTYSEEQNQGSKSHSSERGKYWSSALCVLVGVSMVTTQGLLICRCQAWRLPLRPLGTWAPPSERKKIIFRTFREPSLVHFLWKNN